MLVQHNKDSCFAFAASSHKAQDSRQFGIFKAVSLSAKKLTSVNISNKQACIASTACSSGLFTQALKQEMKLLSVK